VSEIVENATTANADWFFTEKGQRKGPVTASNLLEILRTGAISGDTPVWRKGFSDWQPLRTTEFGACLQDTPPPVAPTNINNALVWKSQLLRLRTCCLADLFKPTS
jgi:hypothetical protein